MELSSSNSYAAIQSLVSQGRFLQALASLEECSTKSASTELDVLRVEVLERTGKYSKALALAQCLVGRKSVSHAVLSVCETSLGLIVWDAGRTREAIVHLQNGINHAACAGDTPKLCWAQLRLMMAVCGVSGPESAEKLLGSIRTNIVKVGDARLAAALHIFVGEVEAKQGRLANCRRHTMAGLRLLNDKPNLWLEAMAHNNLSAVSIMAADHAAGMVHAARAYELACESGAAAMTRAALGNLGNTCRIQGDAAKAIEYFERAAYFLSSTGEHSNASLDGLANALLDQNRDVDAETVLDRIDASMSDRSSELLYAHRYAALTRARLYLQRNELRKASDFTERASSLAQRANDEFLRLSALCVNVEIALHQGRRATVVDSLAALAKGLYGQPGDVFARYERTCALIAATSGDAAATSAHERRSKRIETGQWHAAVDDNAAPAASPAETQQAIASLAAMLLNVDRPAVVAAEACELAHRAGCRARVLLRDATSNAVLDQWGHVSGAGQQIALPIGSDAGRDIELTIESDTESQAPAANALAIVVRALSESRLAHREREERQALWPTDAAGETDGSSMIVGKMQDIMTMAQRASSTSVTVLITGESGTGKELIARAIHQYSPRASRPFIAFNCAAIPADLLESQLFGHRRGAFTGADRDMPGVVRAARGGTLFLDEIGELSLDLQPKLLRFLETGEVQPLGEPMPTHVDVRVVAATNARLDELVRERRFREDLFYRLNVVGITVPPLRQRRDEIPALVRHFIAKVAKEFNKGRVTINDEALTYLGLYPWPGNVRQLQNEVRRMVALADSDAELTIDSLSDTVRQGVSSVAHDGGQIAVPIHQTLGSTVSAIEKEMIAAALTTNPGVEAAARALGISRKGLYLKRQRLGL